MDFSRLAGQRLPGTPKGMGGRGRPPDAGAGPTPAPPGAADDGAADAAEPAASSGREGGGAGAPAPQEVARGGALLLPGGEEPGGEPGGGGPAGAPSGRQTPAKEGRRTPGAGPEGERRGRERGGAATANANGRARPSGAAAGPAPAGVLVVAGTGAGVGKTTVACGLAGACRARGLAVQPFKVGPDFLDGMHLARACGRPSSNLDGWMQGRAGCLEEFGRAMGAGGADLALVEGAMGLFDGIDGVSEVGSAAEVAKWLGAPVLLVLDCWTSARSIAAVVKGFQAFDPDVRIAGLVFNKVGGEVHTRWLRDAVESAGLGVPVLGGILNDPSAQLPEYGASSTPAEVRAVEGNKVLDRLKAVAEESLDLAQVLAIAKGARVPPAAGAPALVREFVAGPGRGPTYVGSDGEERAAPPVRIGVARDEAFCFYYEGNLALLVALGAELVPFSPIRDTFPQDVDGLYFGGGFPELFVEELSQNQNMLRGVKTFAEAGGVVYAECGGLMYLSTSIQTQMSQYRMAGVFPFRTRMQDDMHVGYVTVNTLPDCAVFPPGCAVKGHVYHSSEIVQEHVVGNFRDKNRHEYKEGYEAQLEKVGSKLIKEGYSYKNTLASYIHLQWGATPCLAAAFVDRCRDTKPQYFFSSASSPTHSDHGYAAGHGRKSPPQGKTLARFPLSASYDNLSANGAVTHTPDRVRMNGRFTNHTRSLSDMQNMSHFTNPPIGIGICSLVPSATEVLFALGLGNQVVGVSDFCDHPAEVRVTRHIVCTVNHGTTKDAKVHESLQNELMLKKLASNGSSILSLDVQWLATVRPQLTVTFETDKGSGADAGVVAAALHEAGLMDPDQSNVVLKFEPTTLSDTLDAILKIGAAMHAKFAAHQLVEGLRGNLRLIARLVAGAARRPRVLALAGLAPLVVGGHWLPEMIRLAGGQDHLQDPGDPVERIAWDQVRAYEPEVLVLIPGSVASATVLQQIGSLATLPGWWSLPAVRKNEVYLVDHVYFTRPGPRLVEGVQILARILQPDRVDSPTPSGAVLKLSLQNGARCRPRQLAEFFEAFV